MLLALAVDRTGSGLWAASSVLYLTFVTHLSAQQTGVLLGTAGVAGIAGSPPSRAAWPAASRCARCSSAATCCAW